MNKELDCISRLALGELLLRKVRVKILDVRTSSEYQEKHLPEALNIPLYDLETATQTFNKETLYVTVCGKGGGRSAQAAEKLQSLGFQSAWLCGGTFGE